MSENIQQQELENQLHPSLGDNAKKAAEMLITPLNLGVEDLQNLRKQEPFKGLPEASFNRAKELYAQMKNHFGYRIQKDHNEAQDSHASNRESVRKSAMNQLGDLKDSIVHRGPLTDYLVKNFSGQLNGVEKWSEQFYKAYRAGKTDIRSTAIVGHLRPAQRENVARMYEQVYPFLLGQDFGSDVSVINTYGYRQARDIGRCLAHFCAQGAKEIQPEMLQTSINGTSLARLGIQDDVVKFSGENLYDNASLKKLNSFYQEFVASNGQAKLALLGREAKSDQVAYQTLTPQNEAGDRPFATKSGETLAQFEARQAQKRKEREDYLRKKYI